MNGTADTLPRQLGPYRLIEQLGAGGMGTVYRAEDSNLGREVAVKVLHPHLLSNDELKARFAREARLHASINHPNIVTLYSLHEENGELALIMEMVHGRNLREYLGAPRPLTMDHLLHIAIAILKGLAAAHDKGLVHRDLKPANILIADDGQVKIMDFGLAKQHGNHEDDLTQSGAVVGSYRYMAPEQIMHEEVDARTDLYAFGIVLFRMLTGVLPFDSSGSSGGEFEIMEKQVRGEPPSPLELNPAIPHALNHLLLRLLAKKPDDRPQNCAEVINRLEQILQGGDDTHITVISAPSRHQDHTSAITIASGLLTAAGTKASQSLSASWQRWLIPAVVVALLVGWWLTGSEEQPVVTAPKQTHEAVAKNKETTTKPAPPETQATVSAEQPKQQAAGKHREQPPAVKKETPLTPATHKVKQRPKSTLIALTAHKAYRLRRSDFSRSPAGQDEFSGQSHVFFEELRDYALKKRLHTFKTGHSRLTFKYAQQVEKIIIGKASVGDADFTDAWIRLFVRRDNGRWQQLLERRNEDIDRPASVTLTPEMNPVKEVKLTFKSAEPLELADIRILGRD